MYITLYFNISLSIHNNILPFEFVNTLCIYKYYKYVIN